MPEDPPDLSPLRLLGVVGSAVVAAYLPRFLSPWICGGATRLLLLSRPAFRHRVHRNLSRTLDPPGPRALTRRWCRRLLQMVFEVVRMNLRGTGPRVAPDLPGVDRLREDAAERGALVICPHFGPYMLAPYLLAEHGLRPSLIAAPIPVPWVHRLMMGRYEESDRIELIDMDAGAAPVAREVLRTLTGRGLVLASVDQAPEGLDNQQTAPFLGRELAISTGVFRLAEQSGAAVYGLLVDRGPDGLTGRLTGPTGGDTPAQAATYVAQLEDAVRAEPEAWNWMLPALR